MASTSASSIQKSFTYDVFLSFRGEDTRKTFVDHLYYALQQKGITTYKDDEKIEKGKRINDQLIGSIEDSRFYVIVFSKNYASSSWCLDELVKIMECQEMTEHTAYPVFFDVEPTQVRNQTGVVGEAFAKHAEEDGAGRWRDALKEAAGLAGWELKNIVDGHEAKFIQKIVIDISLKLSFINWSVDENLVGMETRVKDVVSSLEIDSDDVRMIGIKGMGGGGKTTLATAVFDHISIWFEGISFVENVREVSKGTLTGLKDLQKQVLSDVLNDKDIIVRSISDGKNKMKRMMSSKKVLVVLDDVDSIGQLEAISGERNWFKPGSRIIITTRDEQVLVAHRVDYIHDVSLLSHEEAICLLCRYAFGREIPLQGYEELSRMVVHYAAGLPLTIKVLGSFLCGRIECEWLDAIERLKKIPLKETLEKLELSYNGLENDHKEIFLDVACILKGESKDDAIRILESCGFHAEIGLRVLEQKSLITISDIECLHLHDHIEEMGRNIVRRLNPDETNKHSRLWIKEEIEDILLNDLGTEATRSMKMEDTNLHPTIIMKALRNMKELRLLYVVNGYIDCQNNEDSKYLPNTLRSLHWFSYPFRFLPKTFEANKLVNLKMFGSKISQLWESGETKVLNKLRFIELQLSQLRTFDLGMTPNLETLDLEGCRDFVELHMPVECKNLKFVNLSNSKLSNFSLGLTPNLERLDLQECYNFIELHIPTECPKLKVLDLRGSKLSNLNLGFTPNLERLHLERCNDFVKLQMPVECPKLKFVELGGSKVSNLNLGLTPSLEFLDLRGCADFVELHMPVECPKLKILNLTGCKVSNLNIGLAPYLERLDLKNCYCLQEIHAPVGCLGKLVFLDLSGCWRFKYFFIGKGIEFPGLDSLPKLELKAELLDICPLHPNNNLPKFRFKCKYGEPLPSCSGNLEKLVSFGVCACTNLESFSATICDLQHLRMLKIEGSIPVVPKDLGQIQSLQKLTLWMKEIKHLPDSICMLKHLKSLNLKSCWILEQLPNDLGRLQFLEELNLTECISLRDIPNSICNMKRLKYLLLTHCILVEKLPEELGRLECLKGLDIEGAGISRLPQSIFQFKGLPIIGSRWRLESYGFTSLADISRYTASCYVRCE